MDDVGVERVHGRALKLFPLSGWAWVEPGARPFTLFDAAAASVDDTAAIRLFAAAAVESGCGYVCPWGEGCQLVHDAFDEASIAASQFVVSSGHADDPLHDALYFALVNAVPSGAAAADVPVVLAVEQPWMRDVRALLADQEELGRLWVADEP